MAEKVILDMACGSKMFWFDVIGGDGVRDTFFLFCKHEWVETHWHFIDIGMAKMLYYECKKCGKRTVKII